MTDAPDPWRERANRLAEDFAGRDDATVVAVLADAAEPGASWRGAAALAEASASRRRTLVVNLAGAGSGLDGFLEVDDREGLEAVRSGDRRLSEAAVHPPGCDFLYLPSGDPEPGERPRPTEDPGVLRALRRLAGKIREARGLLILYLEAGALPPALAEELVDGAVLLAGADPHLPAGVSVLGRLAASAEAVDEGADPPEGPGAEADSEGAGEESFLPGVSDAEAAGLGDAGAGEEEPGPTPTPPAAGEPGEPAGPGPAVGDGDDTPEERPRAEDGEDADESEPPTGPARGPDPSDPPPPSSPRPARPGVGTSPADGAEADGAPAGETGDEGDAAGEPGSGDGWRRHRRSSSPPWGMIAAGAAAIVLLAGGWWWLAGRAADVGADAGDRVAAAGGAGAAPAAADDSTDPADSTEEAGAPAAGAAEAAEAESDARGSGGADGADDGGPGDAAGTSTGAEEAVASALELGHSVLVASFSSWPVARERADRYRDEQGGVWLVAPTPVRGSLYWRLFAGALPDEGAARELMTRLVEEGVKDRARAWDVRPTTLAYRLGTAPDRAGAEERAASLRERGVPAYVLPAAAAGDTVWQIYAGAYASRGAAARLGEMLEAAGVEAELVTRRGEGGGP